MKISKEDYNYLKSLKENINTLKENIANIEILKNSMIKDIEIKNADLNIFVTQLYSKYNIKSENFQINEKTLEIIDEKKQTKPKKK